MTTQAEHDRLAHLLKVTERERDQLAYRLLKSQDEVERLQDSVDQLSEAVEKASKQDATFAAVRERLGPLVPTVGNWRSVPILTIVDAVAERVKSG